MFLRWHRVGALSHSPLAQQIPVGGHSSFGTTGFSSNQAAWNLELIGWALHQSNFDWPEGVFPRLAACPDWSEILKSPVEGKEGTLVPGLVVPYYRQFPPERRVERAFCFHTSFPALNPMGGNRGAVPMVWHQSIGSGHRPDQ